MDYSDSPTPESKGFPWGCLAFGCLGVILLVVGGIVALGFGGYWFYTSQIDKYTSPDPMVIPSVEISEEEKEALEARVEQFQSEVEAGTAEEALVLTEREINALLSSEGDFENTVYIDLEPDQVSAQVSIPTDELPGAGGRYFNGTVTLHVELEEGNTIVLIEDASVNGQPVPEAIMSELRGENLLEEASTDPEFQEMFTKLKELRIEKDAVVLIPAPPEEEAEGDGKAPGSDAESVSNEATADDSVPQEQAEVDSEPEMLEEIN